MRKDAFRSPVLLFTSAQSKLRVPAFLPVKSKKRSIVHALALSVVPVLNRTIVPVPLCTPPEEPVTKLAVETVVFDPSGIVPVAFTATEPQRLAPVPEAKSFVQLAISEKFSK